MIEQLTRSENTFKKNSLMSELQKISIDATEDLSVKIVIDLGIDASDD